MVPMVPNLADLFCLCSLLRLVFRKCFAGGGELLRWGCFLHNGGVTSLFISCSSWVVLHGLYRLYVVGCYQLFCIGLLLLSACCWVLIIGLLAVYVAIMWFIWV